MGYTHYFPQKRDVTPEQWAAVADRAKRIIAAAPCKLQYEYDEPGEPRVTPDLIRFNGAEDYGHETFLVEREGARSGFRFCKTARKPYDVAVVAVLVVLDKYAPGCYDIGSDGGEAGWEEGKALAEAALGERFEVPAGVRRRGS